MSNEEPIANPEDLKSFVRNLLSAAGTPEDISTYVADALVSSNLRGADSHGVLQLSSYLDEIDKGEINTSARPRIELDAGAMVVLNGDRGIGLYALWEAGRLAMERAKTHGTATVALKNCSHTGRLGEVAERMANDGFYVQIMGGGARYKWPAVAPHGGQEPIYSTNPYSLAMPGGKYGAVSIDFATSAVSEGKISACQASDKKLPPKAVLNKFGEPSQYPGDYFDGGVLLPAAGQKGYGLALIAELLGDVALNAQPEFNWVITAIDLSQLRDPKEYTADAEAFLAQVKAVKPASGFEEVLLPGERGNRMSVERSANGIPIPASTWEELKELAVKYGITFFEGTHNEFN